MTNQSATIIAAAIAATAALLGAFGGLAAGRRQVRDQAAVEHGQWLRGQRQEAYVAFLDAWDTGIKDLQGVIDEAERMWEWNERNGGGDGWELEESIRKRVAAPVDRIGGAVERVALLGPPVVDLACVEIERRLRAVEGAVLFNAGQAGWPDLPRYQEAIRGVAAVRSGFLAASRTAMREAPRPGLSWRARRRGL